VFFVTVLSVLILLLVFVRRRTLLDAKSLSFRFCGPSFRPRRGTSRLHQPASLAALGYVLLPIRGTSPRQEIARVPALSGQQIAGHARLSACVEDHGRGIRQRLAPAFRAGSPDHNGRGKST